MKLPEKWEEEVEGWSKIGTAVLNGPHDKEICGCLQKIDGWFSKSQNYQDFLDQDENIGEHSLDCFVVTNLLGDPWCQMIRGKGCFFVGSDQETKGPAVGGKKISLVVVKDGVLKVWYCKPGFFIFTKILDCPILLLHCEDKVDRLKFSENLEKSTKIAVLQYNLLNGLDANGDDKLVVPFVVVHRFKSYLYALHINNQKRIIRKKCGEWDLKEKNNCYSFLSAMFRVAEWVVSFVDNMEKKKKENEGTYVALHENDLVAYSADPSGKSKKSGERSKNSSQKSNNNNNSSSKSQEAIVIAELHLKYSSFYQVAQTLRECYDDSNGRMVDVPFPSPWHFRVEGKNWLKVVEPADASRCMKEAKVMQMLPAAGVSSPKLVEIVEFKSGCIGLLMEDCGYTLKEVKREEQLLMYVSGASRALDSLHSFGWMHGDLKESNICVDSNDIVRLIDWEYAVPSGEIPDGFTEGYRAPEAKKEYTSKSDMYSFGIALKNILERSKIKQSLDWDKAVAGLTHKDACERWGAKRLTQFCTTNSSDDETSPAQVSTSGGLGKELSSFI